MHTQCLLFCNLMLTESLLHFFKALFFPWRSKQPKKTKKLLLIIYPPILIVQCIIHFFPQGLRIAPLEAPVAGYMFGKGISKYFADMVSKSANYCRTSKLDNVGLMLLCEVALGDM